MKKKIKYNPKSALNLKPWKPGESGRSHITVGASIRQWLNILSEMNLTQVQLLEMRQDKKLPGPKRIAVERLLRAMASGDMADFEDVVEGASLKAARKAGLDTAQVKRVKTTTRKIPQGDGEAPIEEVVRDVELHTTSLEETKALLDYTEGKPTQTLNTHANSVIQVNASILTDEVLAELATRIAQQEIEAKGTVALPEGEDQ